LPADSPNLVSDGDLGPLDNLGGQGRLCREEGGMGGLVQIPDAQATQIDRDTSWARQGSQPDIGVQSCVIALVEPRRGYFVLTIGAELAYQFVSHIFFVFRDLHRRRLG